MANETTTIEITTQQKQQLDELKQVDSESYKSVVGRLLGGASGGWSEGEIRDIAGDVAEEKIREYRNGGHR